MTIPAASVVIPSRGGAQRLPKLFAALAAQSSSDFEAIVVLDGDIDGSASVVDAAARSALPVRAVVFPENRGRSAALNAGFAEARGRVLIRCDDDLLPGPDYVARHVARHAESPEPIGVIGIYRNVYRPSAYARAYGRDRDERFRQEAYRVPASRRWQYWAGNASVTRETYDAVGEYSLDYRAYGWEDVDWGYRLAALGAGIVLAPELETTHTGAAPTTAVRVDKAFHSGAARVTFEAKHGASPTTGSVGAGGGIWARLVNLTAAACDRRPLVILGKVADVVADYLPKYIAEKAISLLVEASALSGHRRNRAQSAALDTGL